MSDLELFLSMLNRCEIQHFDYEDGGVTTVPISPDSPHALEDMREGFVPSPNLTGDSWASANFKFSADGALVGIDISGD
jgi:hypothetical protein